jgi:hypothetical protein
MAGSERPGGAGVPPSLGGVDFPLRSPALGSLIDGLANYTHAELGAMVLKADADGWDPGEEFGSKQKRLQKLFKEMRPDPDRYVNRAVPEKLACSAYPFPPDLRDTVG